MLTAARTEALLKSARLGDQRAEGEHPEAWAEPIERMFVQRLGALTDMLGDDLARLVAPENVRKAAAGLPGGLTSAQIDEVKLLVRQHYLAHIDPNARSAFWNIPEATKQRWRDWGIIGPKGDGMVHTTEAIDEMVIAARVAEILEHTTSYRKMRELAKERPETRAMQIAREIARQHAGYAIDRLADRHGEMLRQLAFDHTQRTLLGQMVSDYLGGKLGQGTGNLASQMRAALGTPEVDRDWDRVAVSETRWAFNYGSLVHYLEEGWGKIYYHVQPNACDYCKRLLLKPDGSPKVFDLDDIIEHVAEDGGMNTGRRASAIGKEDGWRPTALIHPWCRCRPLPYLEGLPPAPT